MAPSWKSIETAHSAPRQEALARLAVASTTMPAEPAMRKPVAPAAMLPVAMIPAMVPATPAAITKIEHAIGRIGRVSLVDVTPRPSRASGQG